MWPVVCCRDAEKFTVEIEENNEIAVTSSKWDLDILSAMWKHLQLNVVAYQVKMVHKNSRHYPMAKM
jgi:hypothetical protein